MVKDLGRRSKYRTPAYAHK